MRRAPREDDRGVRRRRRRDHGEVPRRQAPTRSPRPRSSTRSARAARRFKFVPGALRLGLQEQGRPAAARRGRQLPPVAARHPAGRGHRTRTTTRKSERKADDKEPFAALAFKIINDPHGNLTFFRVYSGTIAERHDGHELDARQARAHRPHPPHARQQARGAQRGATPATSTRPSACKRHAHGRHALRREAPDHPRADGLPRAGHLDRRSSRRPRPTSRSSASRCRSSPTEDPSFRAHTDEETGQTIISRHGRAPPRDHRRPPQAASSRSSANVGKPEVAYREAIAKTVALRIQVRQAVRRSRPVRPRAASRSSPASAARASSSRTTSSAASSRRSSSPRSRRASREAMEPRRARRLPGRRRQGRALRRQLPRRRLVAARRSRSRPRWPSRTAPSGPASTCSSRS